MSNPIASFGSQQNASDPVVSHFTVAGADQQQHTTNHTHKNHLHSSSQISRLESVLSGGTAGLVSRFVVSPLDVLKIRFQIQLASDANGNRRPVLGTGIVSKAREIYRNEGITVFWKGNVPAEFLYLLYGSVQFTTYKYITTLCTQWELGNENFKSAVAGSGAGIAATTATYPLDLFRTRFAANKSRTRSSITGTIRLIYNAEGLRGFFRGLSPTLLSIAPNMGLFFSLYESSRRLMESTHLDHLIPAPELVAGFAAGTISKSIVFPLDVIRKRMQLQTSTFASSQGVITHYSSNVFKCARQIATQEGITGLYKGYAISLIKSGFSSAVSIWVFELSLSFWRFVVNSNTFSPSS